MFRLGSWFLPSLGGLAGSPYLGQVEGPGRIRIWAYHPLWGCIPATLLLPSVGPVFHRHTLHLPCLTVGIQFSLFRFRSPLLAESQLFSFPLPNKMLRLGRFPCMTAFPPEGGQILIRKSRGQRLQAPNPGLSQLVTSFIGYRAETSTMERWCFENMVRTF